MQRTAIFFRFELGMFSLCCGTVYLGSLSQTAMRESPADAGEYILRNKRQKSPIMRKMHFEDLTSKGIVVIDDVLNDLDLEIAQAEANVLIDKTQHFNANDNDDAEIRSDVVMWISEVMSPLQRSAIGEGILNALRCVRSIPKELSLNGFDRTDLGVPFISQLACYDGHGSHYVPHRDTPELIKSSIFGDFKHPLRWLLAPGIDDREYTIILYLNSAEWDSYAGGLEHSGSLRCYLNADEDDMTGTTATEVVDIEPRGGRMVIFDSRKVLHEVRPCAQRRMAITLWIGGPHSRHQWMRPLCVPLDELRLFGCDN